MLVEGPRLVDEGLSAGLLHELFVEDEESLETWSGRCSLPVQLVGKEWMGRISTVKTPQAVLGVGTPPRPSSLEDLLESCGKLLALDAVQDPGNVGVLSRIARGLGINGVIFGPGCAEPFSPKVLRASAGAVFHLPYHSSEDLRVVAASCLRSGHRLILPLVEGGTDLRECPALERFVLVAGNEGQGSSLDPEAEGVLGLTIAMAGGCESLNVASACAAILGRWLS